MKKIYSALIICLFFLFSSVHAQEITLENVSARGFTGMHVIDGKYYYTFYFGEKTEKKGMANFILELFDQDLKPIKKTSFEITKYSELASSAFNGKYFLFIFSDGVKRTQTFITLDSEGNVVKKRVDEKVRRALLSRENNPDIIPISEEEFIVMRPVKEKKFGYEIERIDKEFNSKWKNTYVPDKDFWTIMDSELRNGKIYILRQEKTGRYSDKYYSKAVCYDATSGDEVYNHELKQDKVSGYPTFISVNDKGELSTGGMYFENGFFDDKNSDGLFFARLDPQGNRISFNYTTWKEVKEQIKGEFSSALVGGKTKVLIEDIVLKDDGTYTIIAETFRKSNNSSMTGAGALRMAGGLGGSSGSSSGEKEVGFTVMDFVFFNYDNAGKLASIDRVEKTTREAVVRGGMASGKGLEIALFMKKAGFFCYRYMVENNGKKYIVYKNEDGFKTYAYFLPVGATSTKDIANIDMNKNISEKTNKMGKFSKAMGGNQRVFESDSFGNVKTSNERYKSILPAKPGHMLLWDFKNLKMIVWLEPVPAG